MQSTCTEATRSATLSTSLCQRRSKSWGTEKMQDTKSPSWPRARNSRLRSWLLTSREICVELGKARTENQSPPSHSMTKVRALKLISQEGKLRPRKGRKLAGVTEQYLLRGWDRWGGGGLEGGHWDGAGRPQKSQAGTEAGMDWYCSMAKSNGGGVGGAGSPAGTHFHRSLETNTTYSGGCVSSAVVSAPGQTHWGGPEGIHVWG